MTVQKITTRDMGGERKSLRYDCSLAFPLLHWLTMMAKLSEHRVSCIDLATGETFMNIRLKE